MRRYELRTLIYSTILSAIRNTFSSFKQRGTAVRCIGRTIKFRRAVTTSPSSSSIGEMHWRIWRGSRGKRVGFAGCRRPPSLSMPVAVAKVVRLILGVTNRPREEPTMTRKAIEVFRPGRNICDQLSLWTNGFGLYGMSGNVWQMVCEYHDPATTRFKYRIDDPLLIESSVMGGSGARGEEYLKCGYRLSISAGIRHPDLGFRPVREPCAADWQIQSRRLAGVPLGDGQVLLSWAALNEDPADTGYHVYRATSRDHAGFRLTDSPIMTSTTFVDTHCQAGTLLSLLRSPGPSRWTGGTQIAVVRCYGKRYRGTSGRLVRADLPRGFHRADVRRSEW